MRRFLPAKGCSPFTHEQARFVDAGFVAECSLERALPVVLELLQASLGAASLVSHPAEALGEKLADVVDAVVVQTVNHALNHRAGFFGFGQIRVFAQIGLLGS